MWREDDFEDKGKQIEVGRKDKAGKLINDSDVEPEGKAERFDERAQESSLNARP